MHVCARLLQSCATLCGPTAPHNPPGSSVHGISQARILEWVAISYSRGSSQLRDPTCVFTSPALAGRSLVYKLGVFIFTSSWHQLCSPSLHGEENIVIKDTRDTPPAPAVLPWILLWATAWIPVSILGVPSLPQGLSSLPFLLSPLFLEKRLRQCSWLLSSLGTDTSPPSSQPGPAPMAGKVGSCWGRGGVSLHHLV